LALQYVQECFEGILSAIDNAPLDDLRESAKYIDQLCFEIYDTTLIFDIDVPELNEKYKTMIQIIASLYELNHIGGEIYDFYPYDLICTTIPNLTLDDAMATRNFYYL